MMETSDEKIIKEDLQKSADSYKAQLEVEVGESIDQLQKAGSTNLIDLRTTLHNAGIYVK